MGNIELLLISFLGLAGLGFTGLWAAAGHARQQKLQSRLSTIAVSSYNGSRQTFSSLRLVPTHEKNPFRKKLELLFGFDVSKRDQYPLTFEVIFIVTLLISFIVSWALSLILGMVTLSIFPIGAIIFGRAFYSSCDRRYAAKLYKQFPDALYTMVRAIRVGVPVAEAIRMVGHEGPSPTINEFKRLADEISVGLPLAFALREMAERVGVPEYRFLATALAVQSQTGGTLSDTLQNLADLIRKRVALKERGRALLSEAKATAIILSALPVVVGSVVYLVNPSFILILLRDPLGQKIFGTAVISLCSGILVINRMIRKVLQ